MQRFNFPLESVLKLRRFAEAEARSALGEALAALRRAEAALELTRTRRRRQLAALADGLRAMHPMEVVAAYSELDRLDELALKQAAQVADCESEVATRRDAYLAAQRERKPLDRLKEEMQRTHQRVAEQVEQTLNDELAITRFARQGWEP